MLDLILREAWSGFAGRKAGHEYWFLSGGEEANASATLGRLMSLLLAAIHWAMRMRQHEDKKRLHVVVRR
jgi:hypothetical protein